jgi:large subunit ribosomal protein L6e
MVATVARGVNKNGRAKTFKLKHRFRMLNKTTDAKARPAAPAQKWYPAEDVPTPIKSRKVNRPARLRASITPGTILILLAGTHRGKRVVFLKQLDSGLLLVTGPYAVNGVALRRANAAFVIATSTKIDVSGVDVSSVSDASFPKAKAAKTAGFFDGAAAAKPQYFKKALQKQVDSQLIPLIKAVPHLRAYLRTPFSLSKAQRPHAMKF